MCWSLIRSLKRYTRHDRLFKLCCACDPDCKMKYRLFNHHHHPLRRDFVLSAAVLLFPPLLKPQRGGRVQLHAARDALQTLPVCLPRLRGGRSQRAAGAAQTRAARSGTLVSNDVAHTLKIYSSVCLFVCLFCRWDAPNATRKWSAVTWAIMRWDTGMWLEFKNIYIYHSNFWGNTLCNSHPFRHNKPRNVQNKKKPWCRKNKRKNTFFFIVQNKGLVQNYYSLKDEAIWSLDLLRLYQHCLKYFYYTLISVVQIFSFNPPTSFWLRCEVVSRAIQLHLWDFTSETSHIHFAKLQS